MSLANKNKAKKNNNSAPLAEPLLKALKDANCTMCLIADRADGNNPGVNGPLTNPWVDIANEVGNNLADPIRILSAGARSVNREGNIITVIPEYVIEGVPIWSEFKPNTQYTFSFESMRVEGGLTPRFDWKIQYTDGTSDELSSPNLSSSYGAVLFTSPLSKSIDYITCSGTIDGRGYLFKDLMLNEGSEPLPYEPYTKNNAALVNFAGTTTSGYDDVTVPSGTVKMLKADGVDDYGVIANTPGLDPVGNVDFAFINVIKTPDTLSADYPFCKNADGISTDIQFGYTILSDGRAISYMAGSGKVLMGVGELQPNTVYVIYGKHINGVTKYILNGVEKINVSETLNFVSKPNFVLFGRSGSLDGQTILSRFNGHQGTLVTFYNGVDGLDEAKVDEVHNLLFAPYF